MREKLTTRKAITSKNYDTFIRIAMFSRHPIDKRMFPATRALFIVIGICLLFGVTCGQYGKYGYATTLGISFSYMSFTKIITKPYSGPSCSQTQRNANHIIELTEALKPYISVSRVPPSIKQQTMEDLAKILRETRKKNC